MGQASFEKSCKIFSVIPNSPIKEDVEVTRSSTICYWKSYTQTTSLALSSLSKTIQVILLAYLFLVIFVRTVGWVTRCLSISFDVTLIDELCETGNHLPVFFFIILPRISDRFAARFSPSREFEVKSPSVRSFVSSLCRIRIFCLVILPLIILFHFFSIRGGFGGFLLVFAWRVSGEVGPKRNRPFASIFFLIILHTVMLKIDN